MQFSYAFQELIQEPLPLLFYLAAPATFILLQAAPAPRGQKPAAPYGSPALEKILTFQVGAWPRLCGGSRGRAASPPGYAPGRGTS